MRYVRFEVPYNVGVWLLANAPYHNMEILHQEHTINFLVRIKRSSK